MPRLAGTIEGRARERGMQLAGTVRYGRAVTEAQVHGMAAVEYQQDGSGADICQVWAKVKARVMNGAGTAAPPISSPGSSQQT